MTLAEVKIIFLQDIGEPYATDNRLTFLEAAVDGAVEEIAQTGITLTTEADEGGITALDANLIRMYAAYLVRGRASQEAMPPQLRRALHNRLFSQKMNTEDTDES